MEYCMDYFPSAGSLSERYSYIMLLLSVASLKYLIAFSFGAFLEGAAGMGTPVAITAAMLAGLGFNPLYAAGICLIANTAPVAFGSVGIPIITASQVSGIPEMAISQMVGRTLPVSYTHLRAHETR